MTSYFSTAFLLAFLPATVACYQLAPRRARWAVLLAASYAFFWVLSGPLVVFVIASTVSIWAAGLALDALASRRAADLARQGVDRRRARRLWGRRMRLALVVGVGVNLGILGVLKYAGFVCELLAPLGCALPPAPSIGLPIGISFYTLQAVSYVVDVYRGSSRADRNLARLALYLAFFPQIMEGPICRYDQTASALWAGEPVTAQGLFSGGARMLWGVTKRMVVANRLNLFVQTVFGDPGSYDGGMVALAAALYTLQLYCDFSGTMDVACGMGRVFGVSLPENFRQPFFSRTASEFWQRWHITLGAWFRDYVFYPVSLSGPVKRLTSSARRALGNRVGPAAASGVALLCVWLGNGLWHGAGTQYLLFGLYYFVLIWAGGLLAPASEAVCARMGVARDGALWHAFQHVRTLLVVVAGELLFRSSSAVEGLGLLVRATLGFRASSLVDGTALSAGMDAADFVVTGAFVVALLVVGVLRERGARPLEAVWRRGAVARWAVCCALIVTTVVFGAYGAGYVPVDPMYASF